MGGYAEWPPRPGLNSSGQPVRQQRSLGSLDSDTTWGRYALRDDRAREVSSLSAERDALRAINNRLEHMLEEAQLQCASISLEVHWDRAAALCAGIDAFARWAASTATDVTDAERRFELLELY